MNMKNTITILIMAIHWMPTALASEQQEDKTKHPSVNDNGNVFTAYIPGKRHGHKTEYAEACIQLPTKNIYGIVSVYDGMVKRYTCGELENLKLPEAQLAPDKLAQEVCTYLVDHVTDSLRADSKEATIKGLVEVRKKLQAINPMKDKIAINLLYVDKPAAKIRTIQIGTTEGAYLFDEPGTGKFGCYNGVEPGCVLENIDKKIALGCRYMFTDTISQKTEHLVLKSRGFSQQPSGNFFRELDALVGSQDSKARLISLMKQVRQEQEERFDFEVKQQGKRGIPKKDICAEIDDSTVMLISLDGEKK